MKSSVRTVTPQIAKRYLDTSPRNRRIKPSLVKRLACAISDGRWRVTHQGLAFDEDGLLIDGHHRCHAIIQSGKRVKVMVTHGVKREDFSILDTGIRRSAKDAMQYEGHRHAIDLAASCRWVHRYNGGGKFLVSSHDFNPDSDVILRVLKENPKLPEHVDYIRGFPFLSSRPVLAFVHYYASMIDDEEADLFIEGLLTGENLSSGDPRLVLRNQYLKHRVDALKGARVRPLVLCARAVKAWNLFHAGKTCRRISWRSASHNEAFPKFHGLKL